MVRMVDPGKGLMPPTDEERRQALEALDRIRIWRERILKKRGGRYFTSAAEVIRELREERDQDLS